MMTNTMIIQEENDVKRRLDNVTDVVNDSILPRKMFDRFSEHGKDDSGLDLIINSILDKRGPEDKPTPESSDDRWDHYWAREFAATQLGIRYFDGRYEHYLPGRVLMYERIVDGILSAYETYQNNGHALSGKEVYEIGGGSGISLIMLAKKGAVVTNYDFSSVALKFFRFLSEHYGVKEARTHKGDFFNIDLTDRISHITYNVGVFEHLNRDEREALMSNMVRITAPEGLVLISVPNIHGPHYAPMRQRQAEYHKITGTRSPMERLEDVNVVELMERYGLKVVDKDGVLVAPSVPIRRAFFRNRDRINDLDMIDFYSQLPKTGQNIKEKMKVWRLLEQSATPDERMRYGWFHYYIGRKN